MEKPGEMFDGEREWAALSRFVGDPELVPEAHSGRTAASSRALAKLRDRDGGAEIRNKL